MSRTAASAKTGPGLNITVIRLLVVTVLSPSQSRRWYHISPHLVTTTGWRTEGHLHIFVDVVTTVRRIVEMR